LCSAQEAIDLTVEKRGVRSTPLHDAPKRKEPHFQAFFPFTCTATRPPVLACCAADLRGGSWGHSGNHTRAAYRRADRPELAARLIGFRVARAGRDPYSAEGGRLKRRLNGLRPRNPPAADPGASARWRARLIARPAKLARREVKAVANLCLRENTPRLHSGVADSAASRNRLCRSWDRPSPPLTALDAQKRPGPTGSVPASKMASAVRHW
jgi:hypothetical protein